MSTLRPRVLPRGARRTGALDVVYGMKASKETISTITDSHRGMRVSGGRDPITD
ncbi:hypothetical protein ABZZ80_30300 [Streptomyces sp. NPDC006356]